MVRRRWLWLVPLVLISSLAGFLFWASAPALPMPEAITALGSDDAVTVSAGGGTVARTGDWLVFRPAGPGALTAAGLVIYPGGRVDWRAYAPLARALATRGHLVVIPRMPLNLAVFGPDRAADVIGAFPEVTSWAVGGHSLGGAMAARFAHRNPGSVKGLVLWAAYPAKSDDLSGSKLAVASIYGTLDGLATPDKIEASRALLPAGTHWVAIDGGNHAGFGWYGEQRGDLVAAISRHEQQALIVQATHALLQSIAGR